MICNTNIVFDNEINVKVDEMKTIVNDLACNKYPGLDGVSAVHMKFAGPKLCVLMSMVISSIFTHGFIPRSMMDSVIVPVIKNKNKRINDKCNYRPIYVCPLSARRLFRITLILVILYVMICLMNLI